MKEENIKVINLDLNDILPNRFQPRIKFNEESIVELSESIKEHGLIQPIVVRPISDKYEIIAGERRYKACALADFKTIPAIVLDLNDKDSIEVALIENLQRKDLTPIEEAISYKKTLDMGVMTQEQLASKLGRSQSTIANKIRLLNLCDEVQEALMEEKISERHARSLLKITDNSIQKKLLYRIVKERLTVRKLDDIIEKQDFDFNEESEEVEEENKKIIINEESDLKDESKDKVIIENDTIETTKDSDTEIISGDNNEDDKKIVIDLTNITDYDDLSSIEELTKMLEKDKKENDLEMNNNMQNMTGQFNYNIPTPKNTGTGRFINQVEENETKEETNSGFRLNNEPVVEQKTPDIFTGKMNNLMTSQSNIFNGTTNNQNSTFTNSVSNSNATSIFGNVSFHNEDKKSSDISTTPSGLTPLDLVNNDRNNQLDDENTNTPTTVSSENNTSMFSNLINSEQSSEIIDKQTLNSFLDPSYIDGEKQTSVSNTNNIDEMVFAKFIDPDYEEKTNETSSVNDEPISFNKPNDLLTPEPVVNTPVVPVEENSIPVVTTPEPVKVENNSVLTSSDLSEESSFSIEPEVVKPDLLAPMGGGSVPAVEEKTIAPSAVNPFAMPATSLSNSVNNDITPDNSLSEEKIEEKEEQEEEIPVQNSNSSIFVTASTPNVYLAAPTSPIIDNPSASKLLNVEPSVEEQVSIEQPVQQIVEETPKEVTVPEETSSTNNSAALEIEPIIITDYTKQYDPVIPDQKPVNSRPEFKDILNLIRNLSSQIEKLGYSIDTEEIDLEGSYQVIFNIDK